MKTSEAAPHSVGAMTAVTVAFLINMIGTTLPTSIYAYYQQRYGFTTPVITVIYASYALGVLATLLLAGNWSDQIGRRRMLLAGLGMSAASGLVFLLSTGLYGLLFARLLSGISAGVFTGTASVAIVEFAPGAWRRHAPFLATASNMLGLGCGPLLSGALVQWLPWPTYVPYVVHLLLVLVALAGIARLADTAPRGARIRFQVQRLALPEEVRGAFVPAAIAGFAGFVVVGFFASVVPQLLRAVFGYHSGLLVGVVVFLLFACSTLGQRTQAAFAHAWRMPAGCIGLMAGLVCIALCVQQRSFGALLAGAVLAGLGQGISFRAGLGDIVEASPPLRRAEVTSLFFVVLYVAISLPVIGLGIAVQEQGIRVATLLFSASTIVLVLCALLLLLRGSARRVRGAEGS